MIDPELLNRYNIPVPRYTSYPTVPFWNENISIPEWKKAFRDQYHRSNSSEGISLYIHLPFCESLCTYCGCNKKITSNHGVEGKYIDALLSEWAIYCELMEEVPVIRELHLGGGTPTFFSMKNLERLLRHFLDNGMVYSTPKFSFEGHPNNTTDEHLRGLYNLGFRRVSFGVQDNDAVVQRAINRIQPLENVERVTRQARDAGYESVNYDLIYGLPFQTISSTQKTVQECIALKPDRFAFYSYAHVPWASRGQRLFDENDLPAAVEKMKFYQEAVRIFEANQYHQIGMDHFVLASDDLYKASLSDSLHRNFMGYTEQPTHLQLGLGVSAISDTGNAFAQNQKSLTDYYRMIQSGVLPTQKGYFLNGQDKNFKKYILDISCKGRTYFRREDLPVLEQISFPQLRKLELDGLVNFNDRFVEVTSLGKSFIRNICRAFDLHLFKKETSTGEKVYSRAI